VNRFYRFVTLQECPWQQIAWPGQLSRNQLHIFLSMMKVMRYQREQPVYKTTNDTRLDAAEQPNRMYF